LQLSNLFNEPGWWQRDPNTFEVAGLFFDNSGAGKNEMLKWQRRIAANSIKSWVPFQDQLRTLKHSVKPPLPGKHHDLVLDGIFEQAALIRRAGGRIKGARVLEIGSGWIPIAPLIYRVAGAREVILSDQHRLLHPRSVQAAVAFLQERTDRLARELGVDRARIDEVLDVDTEGGLDTMLEALGLHYIVPLNADTLKGEIDIAYSHTVLEHIPPAVLAEIFTLIRSRLKEGGLFCNGIDNSDHRRSYDENLSIVDFLRYSELAWKLQCINPQDYTNRLRHSDYVALLKKSGFKLLDSQVHVAEKALAELDPRQLPKRFRDKPAEDLCTTWSLMLARA
jgi:SAM-dependent methyltransferase